MRARRSSYLRQRGVSLVETMVAMGVLAVVIPLALAAMLKASEVGGSARAETRAPAMAEQCLMELEAARQGRSAYFEKIADGDSFPESGQVMGLAFSREGAVLGRINRVDYDDGLKQLGDEPVFYLARFSGIQEDQANLMTVTVAIEYPAVKRANQRTRISFHTKLP